MSDTKTQSRFEGQLDDIKGKPYMRAHSAIAWFRNDYPVSEASILTTCIQADPIVWQAEIWIGDRVVARAHASQTNINKDHGKLETNAVRRALAYCGYGTESALVDDDFDAETGESLGGQNTKRSSQSNGNGSKSSSDAPQLNLSNKEDAGKFFTHWRKNGLTDDEILSALGVTKVSEYAKPFADADKAVRQYHESKALKASA